MFKKVDLSYQLQQLHNKVLSSEDKLLLQAKHLLKQDLYTDKRVLENLTQYMKSFEDLDEDLVNKESVYHPSEIKQIAIQYRLKFLETKYYKPEIPYEALMIIKELNKQNRKDIKSFKILSTAESFVKNNTDQCSLLFAKTNEENYYLVHKWGKDLPWLRKFLFIPLRTFENLVITVVLSTLILCLLLPTRLITLDHTATYWSGYRAAAFFHLLIFNFGVTVYFTFTLAKNFSSAVWNQYKDFD